MKTIGMILKTLFLTISLVGMHSVHISAAESLPKYAKETEIVSLIKQLQEAEEIQNLSKENRTYIQTTLTELRGKKPFTQDFISNQYEKLHNIFLNPNRAPAPTPAPASSTKTNKPAETKKPNLAAISGTVAGGALAIAAAAYTLIQTLRNQEKQYLTKIAIGHLLKNSKAIKLYLQLDAHKRKQVDAIKRDLLIGVLGTIAGATTAAVSARYLHKKQTT